MKPPERYFEYYDSNSKITFKKLKELLWYLDSMLESETDPLLINEYAKDFKEIKEFTSEYVANSVVSIY